MKIIDFEKAIEGFKADGKLPQSFEICEIRTHNNGEVKRALGMDKDGVVQALTTKCWKWTEVGDKLLCEYSSKECRKYDAVAWNAEGERFEFVETIDGCFEPCGDFNIVRSEE